jgi:DDE superfamily endonuclease
MFKLFKDKKYWHSRYAKAYYKNLSKRQRKLRSRCIPRRALQHPHCSAWRKLLSSADDQSLITLTGLDHSTFNWLHRLFKPYYYYYTPHVDNKGRIIPIPFKGRGRPRLMKSEDCLGLVLAWTRTTGAMFIIQMVFGITRTSCSIYLRYGRRLLIKILVRNPLAKLGLPSPDKIQEYKAMVSARHPLLHDVWCTMDGLKLKIQSPPDKIVQNRFYNGWQHDTYITGVFVFCPDGTIPICTFNIPGSMHDSAVAEYGNIYKKLSFINTTTGGHATADSAFSKGNYPFLIKSGTMPSEIVEHGEAIAELIHQQAGSMRQSAEWGMRALQSSFPRLKERFIYEENGEQRVIVKLMILLYNLRARKVGINQIKNVYLPSLQASADQQIRNSFI